MISTRIALILSLGFGALASPLSSNPTADHDHGTDPTVVTVAMDATQPAPGRDGAEAVRHDGGAPHWTYDGAEGPASWGSLTEDFGLCATGQEQSPVNLTRAIRAEAEAVQLFWNAAADWMVSNNGHTIQVSTKNGGLMTVDGTDFELAQFHFHTPSEHAIDGRRSPMEVHFVHKSASGALAVVGVMIEGGGTNGLFEAIMAAAPSFEGEAGVGVRDPGDLLPSQTGFYRYQGSLTTPPCSETVLWTVMKEPVQVSERQIQAFQQIFAMNARPLQDVHRRFVLAN